MKNFLLLLCSLVFGLLCLEGAVRYIIDDGYQFDLEMWKYATELKQLSGDPKIGHVHRPSSSAMLMGVDVAINGRGNRAASMTDQAADPAIVMLGDSLTFGWGVPWDETVTALLQRKLAERGLDVSIANLGVGNTNTTMQVHSFLKRSGDYQPKVIVLNYFINDAEITEHKEPGFLLKHSYAATFILGRLDMLGRLLGSNPDWKDYYRSLYDPDGGFGSVEDAVRLLAAHARRNGIGLVLANYPELHDTVDYPFPDVNAKIRALADEVGAVYVELLDGLPPPPRNPEDYWVTVDDAHPNGLANKVYADQLLPIVARALEEGR